MEDIPFEFLGKLNAKLIVGYLHIGICSWKNACDLPIS